jgi:hypothetical protein
MQLRVASARINDALSIVHGNGSNMAEPVPGTHEKGTFGDGNGLAVADNEQPKANSGFTRQADTHSPASGIDRATGDAGILLVADGRPVLPVETNAGVYTFVVPRIAESLLLRSRGLDHLPGDTAGVRRHRVRVEEIIIRFDAGEVVIPADDPRLTVGWHDPESDGKRIWRWTDGLAEIPRAGVSGPVVVTIRCGKPSDIPIHAELPPADPPAQAAAVASQRSGPESPGYSPREKGPDPAGRMHWCVGMYSSGSTWVFNAIRSVGQLLFPGEPLIGVYAESIGQIPHGQLDSRRFVIKSHHSDATATELFLRHADHIWISIRDPRDCVASASTYMYPDFTSALNAVTRSALHCERFILDPRCILMRYEDGYIDDPATLDRFAAAFSRSLSPQDRDRLFQRTRRAAIERMIQNFDPDKTVDDGFPGHRVDMETQWHTHHLNRTGEIGRWRRALDPGQVAQVLGKLGPWMERFGYLE